MFNDHFEPFGDWWRAAGMITAQIHNAWFTGKRLTERDFMPLPVKRQTPEEMAAILMSKLLGPS